MQIEKVESNDAIENFIEEEHEKYEVKNEVVCNYTPFCFTAKIYEKCEFELEFVRKNKNNPKLNKYFYVKYFNK